LRASAASHDRVPAARLLSARNWAWGAGWHLASDVEWTGGGGGRARQGWFAAASLGMAATCALSASGVEARGRGRAVAVALLSVAATALLCVHVVHGLGE
jgi:hypothetical protein